VSWRIFGPSYGLEGLRLRSASAHSTAARTMQVMLRDEREELHCMSLHIYSFALHGVSLLTLFSFFRHP